VGKAIRRISNPEWRSVARYLPTGADHNYVRSELERIANDDTSPGELAVRYGRCADARDALIVRIRELSAEDASVEIEQQVQRRDADRKQAAGYARMGRRQRFTKQCAILWLWQTQGGDPPISTNAIAVKFFQAASAIVFGRKPTVPHAKRIIHDFRHLHFSAAKLGGYSAKDEPPRVRVDARIIRAGDTD
jgi:hypothetical protein